MSVELCATKYGRSRRRRRRRENRTRSGHFRPTTVDHGLCHPHACHASHSIRPRCVADRPSRPRHTPPRPSQPSFLLPRSASVAARVDHGVPQHPAGVLSQRPHQGLSGLGGARKQKAVLVTCGDHGYRFTTTRPTDVSLRFPFFLRLVSVPGLAPLVDDLASHEVIAQRAYEACGSGGRDPTAVTPR